LRHLFLIFSLAFTFNVLAGVLSGGGVSSGDIVEVSIMELRDSFLRSGELNEDEYAERKKGIALYLKYQ
jgi:hypothetical protein